MRPERTDQGWPEPTSPHTLVGRDQELAFIGDFLDRSAVDGGTLLLLGEPGLGKTALLRIAAQQAANTGARVVRAAGSEFETSVTLAGLTPAVMPLMADADHLIPAHREALSVALGLAEGPPPQRTAICQAVLTLLRSIAAEQPILAIVDDLQWMDSYSADVLSFVVRRLAGSRIGVLATSRSVTPSHLGHAGVSYRSLGPLDPAASDALLRSRFPTLAPRVRRRILDDAGGNPLALLELPSSLTGRQRAALQDLPSVLPLSERLQAVFASRVTQLPRATRDLLLLAALEATGDLYVLRAAAGGNMLDDLSPAEREGLVRVDDDVRHLVFRHPLSRSAVVALSTAAERHRAHHALAQVLADKPERYAQHLAASVDEPSEQVAATLEACARQMVRRGDPAGAAAALTRAADLSPDSDDRSRRLSEAAYVGGYMTLQFGAVSELLDQARRAHPDSTGALHAAAAAAYAMLSSGDDIDSAHRLVATAIEAHAGSYSASDEGLIAAMSTLPVLCLYGGRPELWKPYEAALARLSPAPPRSLRLFIATFADPVRTACGALDELDATIDALPGETNPEELGQICAAATYVDRLPGCRDTLRRMIRAENEGGSPVHSVVARMFLSFDALATGRWDEAQRMCDEGLAACASGTFIYAKNFHYHLALLAALRGDHEKAQSITTELIAWATPRGARQLQVASWHVRAVGALGRADFEEAYQNVTAISPAGTFPAYEATALLVCFDLVDAAIHTNRRSAAQAHVAAMHKADIAALSPRLALVTYGSAGMAASDDRRAGHLFDRALAVPGADRWPFDYARVQLAYGERLRQADACRDARDPLHAALAVFERLGARSWVARTAKQLRAAGRSTVSMETGPTTALTAQELEIASLAAAGLTNKQIGEQLHLSHRTVSTHLYRLFPKLGITTRAALRDALTATRDLQQEATQAEPQPQSPLPADDL